MVLVEPHHALRAHTHLTPQHNSDKHAAGFPIFKGGRREEKEEGGGCSDRWPRAHAILPYEDPFLRRNRPRQRYTVPFSAWGTSLITTGLAYPTQNTADRFFFCRYRSTKFCCIPMQSGTYKNGSYMPRTNASFSFSFFPSSHFHDLRPCFLSPPMKSRNSDQPLGQIAGFPPPPPSPPSFVPCIFIFLSRKDLKPWLPSLARV